VRHQIEISVNGQPTTTDVESRLLLVHLLREQLGLTGTHVGCDSSNCGACTVLLDGEAVKSCTVLAASIGGSSVVTVEGLAVNGEFTPVQQGFRECHGLQCGYCTPGMLMASTSLLLDVPDPDEETIRNGLEGNLCRCTGYQMIVESVQWAAANGGPGEVAVAARAAAEARTELVNG
jgi:carbon-monoxide dehydrogenase small subunit